MEHFEAAKRLWEQAVPRTGQAKTRQGELLRAVEKLRDEALRNGNGNWGEGHARLAEHLRRHLQAEPTFTDETRAQIGREIDRAVDFEHPTICTSDRQRRS